MFVFHSVHASCMKAFHWSRSIANWRHPLANFGSFSTWSFHLVLVFHVIFCFWVVPRIFWGDLILSYHSTCPNHLNLFLITIAISGSLERTPNFCFSGLSTGCFLTQVLRLFSELYFQTLQELFLLFLFSIHASAEYKHRCSIIVL